MPVAVTPVSVLDTNISRVVYHSCAKVRFAVDRVGLPGRTDLERVDQKIMGDVATEAVREYVRESFDYECVSYDDIRTDGFREEDPRWDLAVGSVDSEWPADGSAGPLHPPAEDFATVSIKSSRFPERCNGLYDVVNGMDFKIFAYTEDIERDLTSDIEVQVYYELAPSRLSKGIELPDYWKQAADGDLEAADRLARALDVERRFKFPIVVGATTYLEILRWSQRECPAQDRTYRMPGLEKPFWKAPLRELRHNLDILPQMVEYVLARPEDERPRPGTER